MTNERFNELQVEAITKCFDIVKAEIDENYRTKLEEKLKEGESKHLLVLKEAIENFDTVSECLAENRFEQISGLQWQEAMMLIETVEQENTKGDKQKGMNLRYGLLILVGMFRNQFPGEKWNPDDFRWTTIGDTGTRGISPMLMAIAEL